MPAHLLALIPAIREATAGIFVLLASAGLGSPALLSLGVRGGWLSRLAMGLGVGGMAIYALALAGLAFPVLAWLTVAVGLIAPLAERVAGTWSEAVEGSWLRRKTMSRTGPAPAIRSLSFDLFESILIASMLVLLAVAFAGAMVPPVTYDTVAYHLVLPQQQIMIHKATPTPWFLASSLPFLVHAGYLWAQLLGGEWRGPAVVDWAVGVGATTAVFRLAAAAGLARPNALAAALIWHATPIVLLEMQSPLSDLQPCLYAVLALAAFLRWRAGGQPRGWAVAAAWCGLGGACKYVAALVLAAMVPLVLVGPGRAMLRGRRVLVMAALAGLAVMPVLARNWLCDGAPLFPFLTGAPQGAKLVAWNRGISAVERTACNAASSPVRMAWDGKRFASRDLWQVGFLFASIAFLPLFGWRARPRGWGVHRSIGWLALTAAALWLFAFYGYWLVRYILVAGAIGAVLWASLPQASRAGLVAVVVLLAAAALPHARSVLSPLREYVRAGATVDGYLSTLPPYTWPYRSCLYLREQTPSSARVLTVFEPQVFYARRRVFNSVMGDVSMIETLLAQSASRADLLRRLRRLRIGYLLVALGVDAEHARLYLMTMNDRQVALLRDLLAGGLVPCYQGPMAAHAVFAVPPAKLTRGGRDG